MNKALRTKKYELYRRKIQKGSVALKESTFSYCSKHLKNVEPTIALDLNKDPSEILLRKKEYDMYFNRKFNKKLVIFINICLIAIALLSFFGYYLFK